MSIRTEPEIVGKVKVGNEVKEATLPVLNNVHDARQKAAAATQPSAIATQPSPATQPSALSNAATQPSALPKDVESTVILALNIFRVSKKPRNVVNIATNAVNFLVPEAA
jgi:hypothetical protein